MSHTDVGRALIRASQQAVFAALVQEQARRVWLPPDGMTGEFSWFDPRPGGGYHLTLTYIDAATVGKSAANTDVVRVRFIRIEPPQLVVEEADFESDDPVGTMTMTWSLVATPEGTDVTITASGVPDGISSADHATAFASTLANLDRYLTEADADPSACGRK